VLLEVGRVLRPHGLRGEVVVEVVTTRLERMAPGSVLECEGRRLVVEGGRQVPAKAGPTGRWALRFVGIGSRDEAEALRGRALMAEVPEGRDGTGGLWAHEVIGSEVVGTGGERAGRVVEIEANPASDLLVLDSGALVPMCFVTSQQPGLLVVDLPPGLLEL